MPNNFAELGIRPELVDALRGLGLKEPTPVQEQAIPLLLAGKDVMAQAQTGTGKTLAFLLPILERVDPNQPEIQALILTPTRELALQITTEAKKLAPHVGVRVLAVYGGQDTERQIKKLEGATQVVVATPGRLLDHLRRGTVRLNRVTMLVLDEADQMLHMGFLEEVEQVIREAAAERRTMLFSATMPKQIRALAKQYMRAPVEIQVQGKAITLDEIEQVVVHTTDRGKQDALFQKLDEYNPYLGVVFCRTKIRAIILTEAMRTRGYNVDELHGDLSQAKREQVMKRFREAKLQILVATDVAARGIDVEGITHVFNYDIPHDVDSYIHRIGRTGRAGQKGVAVTFVAEKDREFLRLIEQGIQASISKEGGVIPNPSARVARPAREDRPERPLRTGSRRGAGRTATQGKPVRGDGRPVRGADARARPAHGAAPKGRPTTGNRGGGRGR